MGNDINSVTAIGRLTRDAELKYTNSGTAVTRMSLANNYRKRQGEQWIDEVNYFDITLWGKLGESLQQYLLKGKQIAVSGELRQNRWEQDGQNRSKVEIIASKVELLGGDKKQGSGDESFKSSNSGQDFEDDIPY
ncbi:single-stranded DNA-binding protein [Candidatus Pacearchaeota archaeon]|nr:single-stranded DNA-binding protein [Candidatus Pacearchaeota archaeon]